jgi:hypothetical protein
MKIVTVYRRDRNRRPIGAIVGVMDELGNTKVGWSLVAASDRKNARKSMSRELALGRAITSSSFGMPDNLPHSFCKDGTMNLFMQVVAEAFGK